jgi:hypothetical protein
MAKAITRQARFENDPKLEKEFDNIINYLNKNSGTSSGASSSDSGTSIIRLSPEAVNKKSVSLGKVSSSRVIDLIKIVVFEAFDSGMVVAISDGDGSVMVPASLLTTPGHTETTVLKKYSKDCMISGVFSGTFPCKAGSGIIIIKFLDF